MTPDRRGGRDRQREETRQRVYEAALEIFRRDGVAASRIEDVAALAQVSRGTFYFHFPTKDDVLLARLRESEVDVAEALRGLPPSTPLTELLDRLAEALAAAWQDDPALLPDVATVALRVISGSVTDREAEPVRAVLSPHFRAAAERGELRGEVPADALADFYLANALAAMLAWCANGTAPLRAMLQGLNELFLHGALSRP